MMKVLIIRFSSFGDTLQSLSIPSTIAKQLPHAALHFITGSEFEPLFKNHPHLKKIWTLKRGSGMRSLFSLSQELRAEKFDLIYDAHNNTRSQILCFLLGFPWLMKRPVLIRKSSKRWQRFLLFKLRINTFQMPFSGQRDLLEPLHKLGLDSLIPPAAPQLFIDPSVASDLKKKFLFLEAPFIALAPSAAHPLKRWPQEYWTKLIELFLKETKKVNFVLLGGPQDSFIQDMAKPCPQIFNLAGQLSLLESAAVVQMSLALVSNTGLMHVAEQLGHKAIALMGPAPFGFPCRETTLKLEVHLACRPCSKHGQGPCVNKEYQKCLRDIHPQLVADKLKEMVF
jgi:ADP-heptose:LPS heptosyltransferase